MNGINENWNIDPPDFIRDREFSGDDAGGMPAVYIIDRDAEFETKSKDKLDIHFAADASKNHFAAAWSPVFVYRVENLTKKDKGKPSDIYTVAFYRSKGGDVVLAACDCPARVRCKHIVKTWLHHADAESIGYIEKL